MPLTRGVVNDNGSRLLFAQPASDLALISSHPPPLLPVVARQCQRRRIVTTRGSGGRPSCVGGFPCFSVSQAVWCASGVVFPVLVAAGWASRCGRIADRRAGAAWPMPANRRDLLSSPLWW